MIKAEGSSTAKRAFDEVSKNTTIHAMFRNITSEYKFVRKEQKLTVFKSILGKVCHAMHGEEFRRFNELTTKRGADDDRFGLRCCLRQNQREQFAEVRRRRREW